MVENGVAATVFEIPPILVFLQNLHSPRCVGCIGTYKVRIAGILGFNDCVLRRGSGMGAKSLEVAHRSWCMKIVRQRRS